MNMHTAVSCKLSPAKIYEPISSNYSSPQVVFRNSIGRKVNLQKIKFFIEQCTQRFYFPPEVLLDCKMPKCKYNLIAR